MKLRNRISYKTQAVLSAAALAAIGVSADKAFGVTIESLATWDLSNYSASTIINSPLPSFGAGTALQLGMTNDYDYSNGVTGSIATCDITAQHGDVNAPNDLCWRVGAHTRA